MFENPNGRYTQEEIEFGKKMVLVDAIYNENYETRGGFIPAPSVLGSTFPDLPDLSDDLRNYLQMSRNTVLGND